MKKPTRFITRAQSEVRHHDLIMGNVAPLSKSMYREYVDSEYPQCGPAHVFIAEGLMYARGTKEQKAFAFGFYRSWIKAVRLRRCSCGQPLEEWETQTCEGCGDE